MANKKISELTSRTPALSDLILVGDPSSGYSYKCTVTALATIIETDIADTYVTLGTTQTISGAKTFSNNLTLTSVANATITQTKFLTLNGSNVVNYRTGAEVLADIGGASSSSVSGTTNYLAKFTSSSAIGNSVIFESSGNIGIGVTTPFSTLDVTGSISINGRRVFNNSSADLFIGGLSGLAGRGTDTITFYTNNTSRAVFDINGNFGLGTSTPLHPLDVINSGGTGISTRNAETNYSILRIGTDVSNAYAFIQSGNAGTGTILPLTFRFGSNERMRLDASGNLLVGTTTLATGFSTFAQIEASGTTGGIIINSATNNIGRLIFTNNNASGNEGLIRYDGSNQSMQFWTNATERMRLDASGRLGIGTTNIGANLVVQNTSGTAIPSLGAQGGHFQLQNGTYGLLAGVATSGNGWLQVQRTDGTATAYNLLLQPSGGNVGIGTSSPTQSLEVNGNVLVSQGAGNYPRFISTVGAKSWEIGYRSGTTNYEIREDGTTRMVIANGGNVGVGSTSPSQKLSVFGGNLLVNNGVSPDANSGIRIVAPISTTQYNWMIAAQQNINNGFEITPSTAVGGTTFSTPALSVLASGSVGIGTSSPAVRLDVNGSLNIAGSNDLTWGGAYGANIPTISGVSGAGAYIRFFPAGSTSGESMRITSGGLLLVNGTTNYYNYQAQVNGAIYSYSSAQDRGIVIFPIQSTPNIQGVIPSSGNIGNIALNASGGQVGIGTTSPAANTVLDVSTSGTRGYIITQSTSATAGSEAGIRIKTNTKDYYISTDNTSNALKFFDGTAIAERLRITSAGNVGIGTSAPASLLTISGSTPTLTINRIAAGNQGKLSFTDQGTEYAYIQPSGATGVMRYDIGPSTAWGGIHAFFTDQSERMRIKSTGQVRFVPLAADPAGAESGDVYYNSTTNKLKVYNGTAWTDLH